MSKIFITGDTHGSIDLYKVKLFANERGKTLTRDDYVIVLGDFGIPWDGASYDISNIAFWESMPWTTLYIDGNHENHTILDRLKPQEWNGGLVHKISPNIMHLMRGMIFTIGGKSFFTMGGAASIDVSKRMMFIDYWPRELPSLNEEMVGYRNLQEYNKPIDFLLSHTVDAATLFQTFPEYSHNDIEEYLEVIKQDFSFGHHYCGHFHADTDIGNTSFVYNRFIELK